jgi:hypothetical protein
MKLALTAKNIYDDKGTVMEKLVEYNAGNT